MEDSIENQLLALIQNYLIKLEREKAAFSVTPNSELEKDLGIDSLGKVELFQEIQENFNVYLEDDLLAEANTVKDLIVAIQSSPAGEVSKSQKFVQLPAKTQFAPKKEKTIVEVLRNWAKVEPNRPHVYLQTGDNQETKITYKMLLENAEQVAANLYQIGIRPHDTVAIMLPTSEAFFYSFLGIQLLGAVPVPIYPPFRPDKIEEYALREEKILNKAGVKLMITFDKAEKLSELLRVFIHSLKKVTTYEQISKSTKKPPSIRVNENQPALIQFTSGSTSDPKGVLLFHKNLMANIRAIGQALDIRPTDVVVSWLPLYHDMGLIGCWLGSLYFGRPAVIMSPLYFLTRPERWLWAVHYHKGTISASPNFAYELCVKRINPGKIEGLDLSSWRLTLNGAEAVNPNTIEKFIKTFEKYGYSAKAHFPVYGLAESSVALCFPPLDRGPVYDVINLEDYQLKQIANPAVEGQEKTITFVNCGRAIPAHEIRVVDSHGKILPDRVIGTLQFKGPSTMQGYFNNPTATEAAFQGGWCDTGDFAYLVNGELYVTGRKKDIIIKAGRNLYPESIEEITSQVHGIRKGCVAAFGVLDPQKGTEKLIIVAETRETKKEVKHKLIAEITERVTIAVGLPPDQVIIAKPQVIPKTSSGKLQRAQCKQYYLQNQLTGFHVPVWLQVGKLSIKGLWTKVKSVLGFIGRFCYTLYAWLIILFLLGPTVGLVYILPAKLSRRIARKTSKWILFLTGNRVEVVNESKLNIDQPVVLMANHCSYADAPLLYSILPWNFSFIVKKEVAKFPFVKTVIRKHKHVLVDRTDFSQSVEDSQKIESALRNRQSVAIFPEGTFTHATGLRPFKLGGFKAAVEANVPICPVGIKGTRHILRSGEWLLRPSKVTVTIGEFIYPESESFEEITKLHSQARTQIAKTCGEAIIES